MDKAAPDVINVFINRGIYNNGIIIIFKNKVKSSIIKDMHNTKLCFKRNSIVGSTYNCKLGYKIDKLLIDYYYKNLSIHHVLLIVLLYTFLHNRLGTHLLVEYRMRISKNEDINKCEIDFDRSNILLLIATCKSKFTTRIHCKYSMLDYLEEFTTGIDLMKRTICTIGIKEYCILCNYKIK